MVPLGGFMRNFFNQFLKVLIILIILIQGISFFKTDEASAVQKKQVWKDYGILNKEMKYQNPKTVSYPNSDYGDYPSSFFYEEKGYSGTLNAVKIKLTPLEKVYHKDPVYKTEKRTFTKTVTKKYSSKSGPGKTYHIDEDGYKGDIPRKSIDWTENWVKNRYVTLKSEKKDSSWHRYASQTNFPSTVPVKYKDSGMNKTHTFNIHKSGGPTKYDSRTGWVYSESDGRAAFYDRKDHSRLGYMSNNSKTYWGGSFFFKSDPRKPIDYYGPDEDKSGWTLIEARWAESSVQDARDWGSLTKKDGYYWVSDGSNGVVTKNRYRKGVFLKYRKKATTYKWKQLYSERVKLPDYIKDYTATSTYKGQLTKKVLTGYNEYYTSSKWKVEVLYEGSTYGSNIKANDIYPVSNGSTKEYKILKTKTVDIVGWFSNTGETALSNVEHQLTLNNNKRQVIKRSYNSGEQAYIVDKLGKLPVGHYKAQFTADPNNKIKETNEKDNSTKEIEFEVYGTPPKTDFTLDESVWEEDSIKFKNKTVSTEGDPILKYEWFYKKENDSKFTKFSTKKEPDPLKLPVGNYTFKLEATDVDGTSSSIQSSQVKQNELTTEIKHNEKWEKYYTDENLSLDTFFAGEPFIVNAETSSNAKEVNIKFGFPKAQIEVPEAFLENSYDDRYPDFSASFKLNSDSSSNWNITAWKKYWIMIPDGTYNVKVKAIYQNGSTKEQDLTLTIRDHILYNSAVGYSNRS